MNKENHIVTEFEYLERLYPKFKNKFFITGNPRIDILKAPLNKKYIKEASILKKKLENSYL